MANKLMYIVYPMLIHKITPSLEYNHWFKRLDTQLNELTNQNSIKVPKVIKPTNKKTLLNFYFFKCYTFLTSIKWPQYVRST